MVKWVQVDDGNVLEFKKPGMYLIACCDCNLVHRLTVSAPVTILIERDEIATKNLRENAKEVNSKGRAANPHQGN